MACERLRESISGARSTADTCAAIGSRDFQSVTSRIRRDLGRRSPIRCSSQRPWRAQAAQQAQGCWRWSGSGADMRAGDYPPGCREAFAAGYYAIAIARAGELIADEPTTSLDFRPGTNPRAARDLNNVRLGDGLITHDLGVVGHGRPRRCQYAARKVEEATVADYSHAVPSLYRRASPFRASSRGRPRFDVGRLPRYQVRSRRGTAVRCALRRVRACGLRATPKGHACEMCRPSSRCWHSGALQGRPWLSAPILPRMAWSTIRVALTGPLEHACASGRPRSTEFLSSSAPANGGGRFLSLGS